MSRSLQNARACSNIMRALRLRWAWFYRLYFSLNCHVCRLELLFLQRQLGNRRARLPPLCAHGCWHPPGHSIVSQIAWKEANTCRRSNLSAKHTLVQPQTLPASGLPAQTVPKPLAPTTSAWQRLQPSPSKPLQPAAAMGDLTGNPSPTSGQAPLRGEAGAGSGPVGQGKLPGLQGVTRDSRATAPPPPF